MRELLIAGTPLTLGDLVLLVERQQNQISDLEERVADLALEVTALRSGAGGQLGGSHGRGRADSFPKARFWSSVPDRAR